MKRKFQFHLFLLCIWAALTISNARAQTEASPPAKPPSDSQTLEQAQALLGAGKIDAALDVLKAIPKSEPNEPRVNHLTGLAYYQKGDYARAVEYLSIAVKQTGQGSKSYQQAVQFLGLAHYRLGHLKEAIPYLEQVRNWLPDNIELANALGISYIQTHSPEKSREVFARMFGFAPGSASAYLINARMMVRQKFEEFAEKELERALELDPKLPEANFLLGELAIYHAKIDVGINLLEKEIALNPAFAMAYYRLGEAYTRQLKWDQAIAPLLKAIWLNSDFSAPYIVLGKVYLKKGDLANAESILRYALRMDPNNFSGHHLLAQVLQQANRLEEARKEFELADRLRVGSEK